jgi:hypothetical protein
LRKKVEDEDDDENDYDIKTDSEEGNATGTTGSEFERQFLPLLALTPST